MYYLKQTMEIYSSINYTKSELRSLYMCRITGFWNFNQDRSLDPNRVLTSMTNTMTHGGPDDTGLFLDEEIGLGLGHRRLSIIDTSQAGRQPMVHPSDRWIICYNGEVYNFKEIRSELESLGESFRSTSDTEVILHAWARWGEDCLSKFRGMFAFAIWDKRDRVLTLVRDRVGVKPLYWYYHEGLFIFASELKAFHEHPQFKKSLSQDALSLFFRYGYIRAPYSIFEHTFKLEPGYILRLNDSGEIQQNCYWSPLEYATKRATNAEGDELIDELESIITESSQLRMVSDVPVGVFLSGGVDSSLVTALLQKKTTTPLKTFTIGFEEQAYNEAESAKAIANYLGTEHTEYYCSAKEALDVIPKLPEIFDEPFGDDSAVPTYLVSKVAREQVTVALSADGGDEQFAGYNHYRWQDQFRRYQRIPGVSKGLALLKALGGFKVLSSLKSGWQNYEHRYEKMQDLLSHNSFLGQIESLSQSIFDKDLKDLGVGSSGSPTRELFKGDYGESTSLLWDTMHYLPDDILVKVDRAAMSVSLEGREPLLDHKLMEFTLGLSYQSKIRGGYQKAPLRELLYRYLPKDLVDRPKSGFSIPLAEWLQGPLMPVLDEVLSREAVHKIGVLDSEGVSKLRTAFTEGHSVHQRQLWYLLIFQQWALRWL